MSTQSPSIAVGRRGRLAASIRSFAVLSFMMVAPIAAQPGGVSGYRFILPDVESAAGQPVRVTVAGEYEQSAQGFTFAARYPADDLTIGRVHIEDTILEAIGTDFFEANVSAADGTIIVGALVDSDPPFEGSLIPNIGFELDLFHIEVAIDAGASGILEIAMENGLSSPPVDNLYSVDNEAAPVTELSTGRIIIVEPDGEGQGSGFLRGDVNMDLTVDVSDPIMLLNFSFRGGERPHCIVAGDANDDETIDISDPIYVLEFLFGTGGALPPPSLRPGPDPTPGSLGCEFPLHASE